MHGPGNSQPHKVTDCKHKHAVDVHAVKSYSTAGCTTQSPSTSTGGNANSSNSSNASNTTASTSATGSTTASGVLGAIEAAGTLPFTGFPVWLAVGLAVALIAAGLTLRRRARATV